jgi:alpha-tubulin suppressor-like RCC1 family protein
MRHRASLLVALVPVVHACVDPTPPEPAVPAGSFAAVSAGGNLACAIDTIGRGWCWGTRVSATFKEVISPKPLATDLRFKSISAGYGHACALTDDGTAYCWGSNAAGQLAPTGESCQGQTTCTWIPEAVGGGFRFRSISAGNYSTCGITVDGVLKCWGTLDLRKETVVTTSPATVFPSTGDSLWSSVGRPGFYGGACGITGKGTAACWGFNGNGELGIGTYGTDSAIPVAPKVDAPVKSFADGGTCALTVAGDAYCWGGSLGPLLGVGTSGSTRCIQHGAADFICFLTPKVVLGGHKFTQLTKSNTHACGIDVTGVTYCWGGNDSYELGNPAIDFTASFGPTGAGTPILAAHGAQYVSVTAGNQFTCALASDKNVYCWGDSHSGQLGRPYNGDGVSYRSADPVRISLEAK